MKIEPPICPYCGSVSELKDSVTIYRTKSFGLFWICSKYPECDSYVGTHFQTKIPLGSLANPKLRALRTKAHIEFDNYWQRREMPRKAAYELLQNIMTMSKTEAHIGNFNEAQCEFLLKHFAVEIEK